MPGIGMSLQAPVRREDHVYNMRPLKCLFEVIKTIVLTKPHVMGKKSIRPGFVCLLLMVLPAITPRVMAKDPTQLITHDFIGVTFEEFFKYIKKETGYSPKNYSSALTRDLKPITYRAYQVPLYRLLDTVLRMWDLGFSFNENNKSIRLFKREGPAHLPAMPVRVYGKIVDESGDPMGGVSIYNKTANKYYVSSEAGIFELPWPPGSISISITSPSYESKTIKVLDPATFQEVQLKPAPSTLNEVVIMPYHKVKRRNNTAAADKIPGSELRRAGVHPIKALAGKTPGLLITESSGAPGAAVRVQIRGRQSIGPVPGVDNQPQNDPYQLVNKVPIIPGNRYVTLLPSQAGDPQAGGNAAGGISAQAAINPEDIESVDVLKDADATAIYGSRGAHGAILFTTRQGSAGRRVFKIKAEQGAVFTNYQPRMLNNRQYTAMRREALAGDGLPLDVQNAPDLIYLDTNNYVNIPELLIGGTGKHTNVNASLSGGNNSLRYYIGSGFYREGSTLPAHLFQQRISNYGTLQYRSPDNSFQSDIFLHHSMLRYQSLAADPMFSMDIVPLLPRLRTETGKLNWGPPGFPIFNPLGQLYNTHSTRMSMFTTGLQLEYKIWKNIALRTNIGYQQLPVKETLRIPIEGSNPALSPTGELSRADNLYKGWIIEPQLTVTHNLRRKTVSWLVGTTWQEERNEWYTYRGVGYKNDAVLGQPGATKDIAENSYASLYRYHGVYARGNLDWRKKYLLNLTGRLDASSRFGPKRDMSFFGAAGAAWIISEEPWMKSLRSFLTYAKLRGSYGTTGNDNIGDYRHLETWLWQNNVLPYDGAQPLRPNRQANPYLGWEQNRKGEAALELEFIDCISFNAAWYRNITSNQVISMETPDQAAPAGTLITNWPAKVLNTGWEFQLRSTLRWARQNSWTSSLQLTIPRNRLLAFPGIEKTAYNSSLLVGWPLSVQQNYAFLGVDPATGWFSLPDGSTPPGNFNASKIIAGHREPVYYGSWYNEYKLGRFRFSFLLEARRQQAINPLYYVYADVTPGQWRRNHLTNQPTMVLQRWQQPGQQALLQRWSAATDAAADMRSRFFTETNQSLDNASFWRIRTVYGSWDLPPVWVQWLKLSDACIYIQGQNLCTFTGYEGGDPVIQSTMKFPSLRTVTAGIQINF